MEKRQDLVGGSSQRISRTPAAPPVPNIPITLPDLTVVTKSDVTEGSKESTVIVQANNPNVIVGQATLQTTTIYDTFGSAVATSLAYIAALAAPTTVGQVTALVGQQVAVLEALPQSETIASETGEVGVTASTPLSTSNAGANSATASGRSSSAVAPRVTSPVIKVDVQLAIIEGGTRTTSLVQAHSQLLVSNDGVAGPSTSLYYYTTAPAAATTEGAFFSVAASATPTQFKQASSSGLSPGVGAGIGIGCALLGALIAFLIAFILFKGKGKPRSRRRHRSRGPLSDSDAYDLPESKMIPTVATTVSIPQDSAAAVVFNNKPLPKEDNYISDEVSRIKTRIDNHINTYYLRSGGNDKAALDAFAQLWASHSPVPLNRLPSLLADSRSRAHILRAGLAWLITRRIIAGSSGAAESLLPAGISNAYADLANNRLDPQARSAFLSEWRVMTATLSGSLYGQETINPDDPRLASIRVALGQADKFLAPLANNADHDTRIRHLEEIMKRATRLAWTLFSQPSEFQTDWTDEGRGVVVFPSLLQTTDEDGKGLRPPRVFGQKDVVPL